MGRGKVELRRIENKKNRQATFAKRKNGLMKKASELSILCDTEVALIIFSTRGKLYEFCSGSTSMNKIIERYQRCCYTALHEGNLTVDDTQMNNYQEYVMLKARLDALQHSQRSLLGEDMGELSTKELERLEVKLDASLKKVRSSKTQMLLNQLSELHKKEQVLVETNKALKEKLEETCTALGPIWEDQEHHYHHQQDQIIPLSAQADDGFRFHPLHVDSSFTIGSSSNYNSVETNPQKMKRLVPSINDHWSCML